MFSYIKLSPPTDMLVMQPNAVVRRLMIRARSCAVEITWFPRLGEKALPGAATTTPTIHVNTYVFSYFSKTSKTTKFEGAIGGTIVG